jgi:hypothetical protein
VVEREEDEGLREDGGVIVEERGEDEGLREERSL